MTSLSSIFAPLFPARRPARVYVDAATFDPDGSGDEAAYGIAVILFSQDEADSIAERVKIEKQYARGVVVLDQGSKDGTPILAAEAGAVVVLQEAGRTREEALQKAVSIARQFAPDVEIRCD